MCAVSIVIWNKKTRGHSTFTLTLSKEIYNTANIYDIIWYTMYQIMSVALVIVGEFCAILAEIFYSRGKNFYTMAALMTVAGIFLLLWYGLGYKHLKSLWIIYVVSITAILILEPIIIYMVTGESASLGTKIWFACGVVGFLAVFLIK